MQPPLQHDGRFCQQGFHIEADRRHHSLPGRRAWPLVPGFVPRQLETVAIGIAEIERFAHAVVGAAVQFDFCLHQPTQGIRQSGSGGVKDGGMIEPGGARRRWDSSETFPGIESDEVVVSSCREECRLFVEALHELKTEDVAVKGDGALEVRSEERRVGKECRL